MPRPPISAFLKERFGANWVVARRTPRIVAKYGADVVCLSPAKLRAATRIYREAYGDPYDDVRANLYIAAVDALLAIEDALPRGDKPPVYVERLEAAIKAEARVTT